MNHLSSAPQAIQLSSQDPIWEWHVPSDTLWISKGSAAILRLEGNEPHSMKDFFKHVPEDCLDSLRELIKQVLNGTDGSMQELMFPLDTLLVHMFMLVVERDGDGRSVRLVGQFRASFTRGYRPSVTNRSDIPDCGFWRYRTRPDKRIYIDEHVSELLGMTPRQPRSFSLDEVREQMHPEDGAILFKRYQLLLEHPQWGNTVEDILRIRTGDGSYGHFVLYGSVLERDKNGYALELVGTCQPANPTDVRSEGQDVGNLLWAIQSSGDGLWDWDATTGEVYFSPRYLAMLGYSQEQFPSRLETWEKHIHPDDLNKIVPAQLLIAESPAYGDSFECTYRMLRADGSWAWILGRGYVTHRDSQGKATRLVGLHTDITGTQGERAKLEDQIRNDALTGLRSRAFFNMEKDHLEEMHVRPVAVIVCDVDGLKLVNDYLGHNAGDSLLCTAAKLLQATFRSTDCVARMGGDEFTILLPGCSRDNARVLLDKLLDAAATHSASPEAIPLYLTCGLAWTDDVAVSIAKLVLDADRNMIQSKHANRARSHQRIKAYIERQTNVLVSLDDCRCK